MNITIIGLLAGLLLLAVPLWQLHMYGISLAGKTVRAFCHTLMTVGATGLCLYFIFRWNHWAVNTAALLLMAAAGTLTAVRKSGLDMRHHWIPVGAGMLAAVLTVGAWMLLPTLGVTRPLDARYLLPAGGLLTGSLIRTLSASLRIYYAGLRSNNRLYEYLLGNGASHGDALAWFARRAMQKATTPHLSAMATQLAGTTPVVMWAMLLGGATVVEAVATQIIILLAAFSASVIALVVTIVAARRYAFDDYLRLRR